MTKTAILGSGSWGTALAALLCDRGHQVTLWGREDCVADAINRTHCNPAYLGDIDLPPALRATTDLTVAAEADLVVFVVPSAAIDELSARLTAVGGVRSDAILLSCAKGIELGSGRRMSEIIADHFPANPVAVLSGPNHAEEVVRRQATAATIGCPDHAVAVELQDTFTLPWFRTYTTTDVVGMEWAGASKNVYAIAAGIVQGLRLGDNANAALITRGLAEMVRLGQAHGGRTETFYGLAGVGDLVATCFSEHSRNFRFGRAIGEGRSVEETIAALKMVAEGYPNTRSIHEICQVNGVEAPIAAAVHEVLYQSKPPLQALQELFSRDPKSEQGRM